LLLKRGADGRFTEVSSASHAGFRLSTAEDRFVISHGEKTLRFFGLGPDELLNLGSVTLKWGRVAEQLKQGRRRTLLAEGNSWFSVAGLDESIEQVSRPKAKPKPKTKTRGPVKLALERSDTAPSVQRRIEPPLELVGLTRAGKKIVIDRSRVVALDATGGSAELVAYEPGTQLYVASVHPDEERVLIGGAPVFPVSLVEIDIATGQRTDLGVTAQRAAYLGPNHVVVLGYQTKSVTLVSRALPSTPVFELPTEAAALCAHPASGWLLLTGIGAMSGKPKTELHRLTEDSAGVRLTHVADVSPKSKRLNILFVQELILDGELLHFRAGPDWYRIDTSLFG